MPNSAKHEAKHTPTPWTLYVDSIRAVKNGRTVTVAEAKVDMPHMRDDSTGRTMDEAKWKTIVVEPAEAKANAQLIVTAVNQHDTLVQQVKSLREALETVVHLTGDSHNRNSMLRRKVEQVLRETEAQK